MTGAIVSSWLVKFDCLIHCSSILCDPSDWQIFISDMFRKISSSMVRMTVAKQIVNMRDYDDRDHLRLLSHIICDPPWLHLILGSNDHLYNNGQLVCDGNKFLVICQNWLLCTLLHKYVTAPGQLYRSANHVRSANMCTLCANISMCNFAQMYVCIGKTAK